MSENSDLRVFVDSNVLLSAIRSEKSVSSHLLSLVIERHHLVICSYSITEVSQVISKRFPEAMTVWDSFLTSLEFELTYTPAHPLSFSAPPIRDPKDLPILVSALAAQPDIFVTGDQDFHTPEIQEHLVVLTPSEFLRAFAQ